MSDLTQQEPNTTRALLETPFVLKNELETGVFLNMPFAEYAAIPAVNSGLLREMDRSPGHGMAYLRNGKFRTEALELGQHIHTRVLEPKVFAATYVMVPNSLAVGCLTEKNKPSDRPKTTKMYEYRLEAFKAKHPGKTFIDEDDWNTCNGIADRVTGHARANLFINGANATEVTVVWKDEVTDLPCKARLDSIHEELGVITDLKSTLDARPHKFNKALENYGYDIQGAYYLKGGKAGNFKVENYAFVPVEKEDPWACSFLELDPEVVIYATRRIDELLALTKECIESGNWPCYEDKFDERVATYSKFRWDYIKGIY